MKKQYPEFPGWIFDIDEVSAGVYEVVGRDRSGHSVSFKGIDPEELLGSCKEEARRILLERH
jgi:hypothetical protein